MDGTEFILAIIVVGCITSIIKTWINRDQSQSATDQDEFNRLAKAFIQHKRTMQKRVENLEAIIASNDQFEETDSDSQSKELNEFENANRLTNDLQHKDRIRQ